MSKKKLIFIHIPKCGGQTVLFILKQIFGWENMLYIGEPRLGADVSAQGFMELEVEKILAHPCIAGHIHYSQVRKKLGIEVLKKHYLTCALIRNPVDQVISLWNYINTHHELDEHHRVSQMNFEDFAENYSGNQQTFFICGQPDGRYAAEIVKEEYSLVKPLEKSNDFIEDICKHFNYSLGEYDVKNKSQKLVSKRNLDQKVIELIEQKNSEDLILYKRIVDMKKYSLE